jgi:hypothetical protein
MEENAVMLHPMGFFEQFHKNPGGPHRYQPEKNEGRQFFANQHPANPDAT